jgi:hypothetical protein
MKEVEKMPGIDKPWRLRNEENEVVGYICERLGCHTDALVAVANPHSALESMVCKPCRWARARWDEMNRSGKSKSYSLKILG